MNWDQIESKWKDFKGNVRSEWGKLTGDDLENIKGKRDQLRAKIQERYGIAKDEADKQIQRFLDKLNVERPHTGAPRH